MAFTYLSPTGSGGGGGVYDPGLESAAGNDPYSDRSGDGGDGVDKRTADVFLSTDDDSDDSGDSVTSWGDSYYSPGSKTDAGSDTSADDRDGGDSSTADVLTSTDDDSDDSVTSWGDSYYSPGNTTDPGTDTGSDDRDGGDSSIDDVYITSGDDSDDIDGGGGSNTNADDRDGGGGGTDDVFTPGDGPDDSQTNDGRQDPDNWDGDPDTGDTDGMDPEDGSASDVADAFDALDVSANQGAGGDTQSSAEPTFTTIDTDTAPMGGLTTDISLGGSDLFVGALALFAIGFIAIGGD